MNKPTVNNFFDVSLARAKDIIKTMSVPNDYQESAENFRKLYSIYKPKEWLDVDICFPIANYIARHRPDIVDIGTRYAVQVNLFIRTIIEYHDNPDELLQLVGNEMGCFGLTESEAGVLTGMIVDTTFEEKEDHYIIDTNHVTKRWLSQGFVAKYGLIMASNVENHRDCRLFFISMESPSIEKERIREAKVTEVLDVAKISIKQMRIPKNWCLQKTISLSRNELLNGIFYGRVMIAQVVMNSISGFVNYVKDRVVQIEKFNKAPLKISHLDYITKLSLDLETYCENLEKDVKRTLEERNLVKINSYKVYCTETAIQIYNKIHLMFGTHAFDYGLDYQTLVLNKVAEGDASVLRLALIHQLVKSGYKKLITSPGFTWKQMFTSIRLGKTSEGIDFLMQHSVEISDKIMADNIDLIEY